MKYRAEIDGLRAIAVISVIAYHSNIKIFTGGFIGVDIFFVISGFLITSILLNDLTSNKFSISFFYKKRIQRIFPALFFVMLTCLPFAWLWLAPSDIKSFAKSLITTPLFISNFLFFKQSDYFSPDNELKPLIHTWSLAVEEQFYLLFPPLIFLLWNSCKKAITPILIILCIISLIVSEYTLNTNPELAFYMLPTRAWEIGLGSVVATYSHNNSDKDQKILTKNLGALAGALLILYSLLFFSNETTFPGLNAIPSTLGTALIIFFGTHETYVGKILKFKPFVYIGLISYSAYLWHQPLFAFARIKNDLIPLSATYLIAITFVLAYLTWKFIEQPFRNNKRFTKNQIFTYALIGSIFFIIIGVIGNAEKYFRKYRLHSADHINLFNTVKSSPMRAKCHTGGESYLSPQNACEYFSKNVEVAVMGDSHAVELAYSLATELEKYGIGIKHLSYSGCRPIYQAIDNKSGCARWTSDSLDYISRNYNINTVIISYRINQYLFGKHEKIYPQLPNEISEAERSETWNSLVLLLNHLQNSGKKVFFIMQAPEVKKQAEDLIFSRKNIRDNVESVPLDWWNNRNSYVMKNLKSIPKEVIVINPADSFCDDKNCYLTGGGESFYFDDDHMSVAGSKIIANRIIQVMLR